MPLSTSKNSKIIKGNEITHYSLKAHDGPVKQLLKTKEGLLLTSSDSSDPVIKIWDLNGILNPTSGKKSAIMLVSVFKGHTSNIIGCDFLGNKNLISVDESGILNVFNYNIPQPVASQMINKASFKEVAFFTNKQQFALLSTDNRIFIIQLHQVNSNY